MASFTKRLHEPISSQTSSFFDSGTDTSKEHGDGHERLGHDMEEQLSAKTEERRRDHESIEEDAEESQAENHAGETKEHDLELAQTRSIAETLSPWREFMFVSLITMAQFLTQAGLGQLLSILHVIGDHYGITNPGVLSWLIAGYSLTVGSFILVSGRLGDLFGYKRMLLIGFTWFGVWSLVAGLASYSNSVLFIWARVLQGIGPSICLPNGLAILGATYAPGPRKGMVFSIFGAAAPGGSIVGAAFAGLFALRSWPWAFYSLALALFATAILGTFVIPNPPRKDSGIEGMSTRQIIMAIDLPGCFTGILSLVLINFAWNQSGVVGWAEPYVYVCLILGILIIPIFFYIELRVSSSPLIPFDALSADVGFVLACIACGWGSFGIWIYYIWQFMEVLKGASPLLATAYLCPVAVSGAVAAITTGYILGKVRPAWVMTMAMTFFTIGSILIATAPVHQTYWAQLFVCSIIIPWGMDMSFPAATIILSDAVAKKHQGIAASLVNTIVNYSISLSLGFAGTVEAHVNHGGSTPAELLEGYRGAWYMGIGLAGFGLLVSITYLIRSHWHERNGTKVEKPEG